MDFALIRSIVMAAAPGLIVIGFLQFEDLIAPLHAGLLAIVMTGGVAFAVRRRATLEDAAKKRLRQLTADLEAQRDDLRYKAAVTDKIVASLPHPIFFLDEERRIVRANDIAHSLVETDLTGRDFADGLRNPALLAAIDLAIAGDGAQTVDVRLPVPVETEYIVRVQPVDTPPGVPAGPNVPAVLVDMQDVTALRRSEQMRVDFVANVSHELRTPLTSLTGFIETLRGPARDDPDARESFLSIMQEQSERMFRLINDLLSLSRIELDEHSRPRDEVDVTVVLTRLIAALSPKAQKLDVEIVTDWAANLPPVRGDDDQLYQVFQNLLDNALKYGARGDRVEVSARLRDTKRLVVDIRDYGHGIPAEHLPRLTERFYRVDTARSRELGGTGLGLAIVKHIVNRHRGRLLVASTVGEGSTFSIVLPLAQSQNGSDIQKPDEIPETKTVAQ